jgi:hypothetical protein
VAKIYNELFYARHLIKNQIETYRARDIVIMAKYYKSLGWKNKDIQETLLKKCENDISGFNIHLLYRSFLSAIKKGCDEKNNPLIIVKPIKITESEISWFEGLPYCDIDKKILFTWYVLCRIKSNDYKKYLNFYNSFAQFKRDCNISSKTNMNVKIRNFVKDQVISVTNNNVLSIDYFEKVPVGGKINFLFDFYNIGYWFDTQTKETIKCVICGELVVKTGNKRKYCPTCAKEQKIIKTIEGRNMKNVENRKNAETVLNSMQ